MTNPFAQFSKTIAPAFNRAAPDTLRWSSESAFFEKQIRDCKTKIDGAYRNVLLEGIESGVEATIESCRAGARQFAAMGLSMNPSAKLAYFIPRRARERRDGEPWSEYAKVPWLLDPTPSYLGLCYIGTHYASAKVFGASEVYAADGFILKGPFELPQHRPTTAVGERDERHAIGVYAAAFLAENVTRCEYVDAPTVQRIRALSKVPNSLMYTTVWTEGWKKIALRRLCKLVIQTNDRWLAAEEAMTKGEGYTFDNDTGAVVEDVPRGTSGEADAKPARGLGGLKARMETAQERVKDAQANGAPEPASPTPPSLLALPAPSGHPEGSIEWWLDQVRLAPTLERMDEIKVAALEARLDQGDDADAFRSGYVRRSRQLRVGEAP